jgi:CCR4-NOT transcription complex subunit 6
MRYDYHRYLTNDQIIKLISYDYQIHSLTSTTARVLTHTNIALNAAGEPPPPREWQYNTALSNADMKATLRVMCYNILADSYTGPATVYCPRWAVHWDYRKQRLLNELNQCNADVICLQEVENESFTTYFEPEMERLGYLGVFRPKSRARTKEDVRRVDGCAIFFKSELFDLLDLQLIEFQQLAMHKYEQLTGKKTNNSHDSGLNRLMTKDNIALVVLLRVKSRARARLPHDRVMVVTTHIHWDPEYCDVKLMQTQLMLEQLEELNARYLAQINKERGKQSQGWLPMLLCGDFNSMPDSGVYQLLHTGHVDNNHQDFVDYQYGSYTASNGTGLNHNIPLRSSYAQVGGEPPFTNFTSEFVGVLDYIWYTPHAFTPLRVLKGVDPSTVLSSYGALPNPFMCSDHIPLLVEVLFASPQGGFAASPQKFKH